MILKRKTQNPKTLSLGLVLLLLIAPFIFKAQTVISSTVTGDLQVGGIVLADSSIVVNDTMHAQDIVVSRARITGDINLGGKLLFAPNNGISYRAATSNAAAVFSFGNLSLPSNPATLNPCVIVNQDPWFSYPGRIQIYDAAANVALTMGSDGVQNSIDASGNNGLLINYYCGKNIFLGTGTGTGGGNGTAGSKVYVGDEFLARKNAQIGAHQTIDPTVMLNILNVSNKGLRLWALNPGVKLIGDGYDQFTIFGNGNSHWGKNMQIGFAANSAIQNTNTNLNISSVNTTSAIVVNNGTVDAFRVLKNGETYIGVKKVQTLNAHANAILQVNGKIACTELVVLDPVKWADFVFEKDYKLTPINEVETFYLKNHRLKDVPSAKDVKENGINSAEMDAILLQKIEELTLYTVELNKQVQLLKKENAELKNNIKNK